MPSPRPPLEPLLAAPQKALKEWAVVCGALGDGRQSVLLRKGGIIEETREFRLVESRFLLYPTFEHQDPGSVQERFVDDFTGSMRLPADPTTITLTSWAEVTDLFLTHDLDAMLELSDRYAWSHDYIRMRMAYKPRKPMNVVVVRAYRLASAVTIAIEEHFAGCKSWVPLSEVIDLGDSTPVLTDDEHRAVVQAVSSTLDGVSERVVVG